MRRSWKGRHKMEHDSHLAFARSVTAIYGLNLALSYENAAVDRLEQRASQCIVPEAKPGAPPEADKGAAGEAEGADVGPGRLF